MIIFCYGPSGVKRPKGEMSQGLRKETDIREKKHGVRGQQPQRLRAMTVLHMQYLVRTSNHQKINSILGPDA